MESKLLKRRFPAWLIVTWGGFNAGALFGLADALAIIMLGLSAFERGGAFVGLIAGDAFGCGLIGIASVWLASGMACVFRIRGRRFRPLLAGLLTMLVCGSLSFRNLHWAFREPEGVPPGDAGNILIITLDTLRADALGCGGNSSVRTPMLDHLAARGVQFCNAVCTVPMTTPSHASMLTSTIPAVHGALENRYRLNEQNQTLPEVLRERGYRTAAFVSCYPLDRRFGLDQGFMLYHDRFGVPGDLRQMSWLKPILEYCHRHDMERIARHTNSLVIPWIRRYSTMSPFFLWIHYFDPHAPYAPPPQERQYYLENPLEGRPYLDDDDYKKARNAVPPGFRDKAVPGVPEGLYLGEVSETDRALERVFREIAARKVLDRTTVCLVADHGESMGEHGLFYTHGEDIYEPALHVPMIWFNAGPDRRLNDRLVSLIDIAPTVLTRLGFPIPEMMEGMDLFIEHQREGCLVENYGLIMTHGATKQRGFRTGEQKYILSVESQTSELYNLEDDPGETRDLAAFSSSTVESLKRMTTEGFDQAAKRRIDSVPDTSDETMQRLKSLGYFQ